MTLVVTCHIVKCVIITNKNCIQDYVFLKKLKIALLLRHTTSSTFQQSRMYIFVHCVLLLHVSSTLIADITAVSFSFLRIRMRVAAPTGVTAHLRRQLLHLYGSYISKVDRGMDKNIDWIWANV